jgi:hypothetical protein
MCVLHPATHSHISLGFLAEIRLSWIQVVVRRALKGGMMVLQNDVAWIIRSENAKGGYTASGL